MVIVSGIYVKHKLEVSAQLRTSDRFIYTRRIEMVKAGDVFENPVTGEYGYVRVGTEETNGELIVSDLRLHPGPRRLARTSIPMLTNGSRPLPESSVIWSVIRRKSCRPANLWKFPGVLSTIFGMQGRKKPG